MSLSIERGNKPPVRAGEPINLRQPAEGVDKGFMSGNILFATGEHPLVEPNNFFTLGKGPDFRRVGVGLRRLPPIDRGFARVVWLRGEDSRKQLEGSERSTVGRIPCGEVAQIAGDGQAPGNSWERPREASRGRQASGDQSGSGSGRQQNAEKEIAQRRRAVRREQEAARRVRARAQRPLKGSQRLQLYLDNPQPAGTPMPKREELAEMFEISPATVNRVLRRTENRDKVHSRGAEGTFWGRGPAGERSRVKGPARMPIIRRPWSGQSRAVKEVIASNPKLGDKIDVGELAQRLGVSPRTVSNGLRRWGFVETGTQGTFYAPPEIKRTGTRSPVKTTRVIQGIEREIEFGELRPGRIYPKDIARKYGVHESTARRALLRSVAVERREDGFYIRDEPRAPEAQRTTGHGEPGKDTPDEGPEEDPGTQRGGPKRPDNRPPDSGQAPHERGWWDNKSPWGWNRYRGEQAPGSRVDPSQGGQQQGPEQKDSAYDQRPRGEPRRPDDRPPDTGQNQASHKSWSDNETPEDWGGYQGETRPGDQKRWWEPDQEQEGPRQADFQRQPHKQERAPSHYSSVKPDAGSHIREPETTLKSTARVPDAFCNPANGTNAPTPDVTPRPIPSLKGPSVKV